MEMIFVDGCRIYSPSPTTPHFVLGSLVFDVKEFTEFMKQHETLEGKVKVDILKSKGGKTYLKLQNFANHGVKASLQESKDDLENILF